MATHRLLPATQNRPTAAHAAQGQLPSTWHRLAAVHAAVGLLSGGRSEPTAHNAKAAQLIRGTLQVTDDVVADVSYELIYREAQSQHRRLTWSSACTL